MKFATIHDVIVGIIVFFEYDEFAWATIGKLSKKTRAHDASVVENKEIAWLEKVVEVAIIRIGIFASFAV